MKINYKKNFSIKLTLFMCSNLARQKKKSKELMILFLVLTEHNSLLLAITRKKI